MLELNDNDKKRKTLTLMTHVVVGYPSLQESEEIVCAMVEAGVSLVELQIPFSDPMADGPTIMKANEHALSLGVTTEDCFLFAERLSKRVSVPLLFMSYYNKLFSYRGGIEAFLKRAKQSGITGLIVPDIPPEETSDGYWTLSKKHGITPVPIVSPVSDSSRLKRISKIATSGFVYCVSTTGTTGARTELPKELKSYLTQMRKVFKVPLALGFGISTPEHIQAIGKHADIAVIGSATIDLIEKTPKQERISKVKEFISSMVNA